jgi:hypothetical protein
MKGKTRISLYDLTHVSHLNTFPPVFLFSRTSVKPVAWNTWVMLMTQLTNLREFPCRPLAPYRIRFRVPKSSIFAAAWQAPPSAQRYFPRHRSAFHNSVLGEIHYKNGLSRGAIGATLLDVRRKMSSFPLRPRHTSPAGDQHQKGSHDHFGDYLPRI